MYAVAAILCGTLLGAAPLDVPLSLWTSPSHPSGLNFRGTMGVSFGDYDGDGFIDIFACYSGNLWRNLGGIDWQFAADLSSVLPMTERRYGASFGDYDNDGLPDIATASRVPYWGDDRMHLLLHNNGGGANYTDVADDPEIVETQPHGNLETVCWADVNGDGNLDLFLPAYPDWAGGPGNFFLLNQGPAGPQGAYRFTESSAASGLDNPPGTARPEGAQFADIDGDGDIDLFANGTLYRNVSTRSVTRFNPEDVVASGIALPGSIDEGAMFFDYDLDGDFDLFVVYTNEGIILWENRGDGTFQAAEAEVVDAPLTGLNLGMSAEDWDNDGDVDFTTRAVFRRNMLVEKGKRHFVVASTSIPERDLVSATPAWGDWDRDGDLDCALGNWGESGRLYANTLYSTATQNAAKSYVRVRAVHDSLSVARGLETEYGATAEVRVLTGTDPYRRRKFVASSHGYLNQNEYALHFGLPLAARVDLSVDFPGLSADGLWRVDKAVNPALGNIDPQTLTDREITVTRCGQVVIDGVVHDAIPLASARLTSTERGSFVPSADSNREESVAAPPPDRYVGLAFDTANTTERLAVKEILLDGQLDAAMKCTSGDRNIALWDVTDAEHPFAVAGGIVRATTSSRNLRSAIPVDVILEPRRSYRLVARVSEYRATTIAAPYAAGAINVQGGLFFNDAAGCGGMQAAQASTNAAKAALAIRFGPLSPDSRTDPVGPSLRLSRDAGGSPRLSWQDSRAPGYRILRCSANPGPCLPGVHAVSGSNAYTDTDVSPLPGESFWYSVKAVNGCAAGL